MEDRQSANQVQEPLRESPQGAGGGQGSPQQDALQRQDAPAPAVQAKPSTSGLAVAGLVLGILAILGAFVPLLNVGALPFAIVGLVLALVGLSGINKGKHSGRGIAVAGVVLGALSLVVIIGMYGCAGAVASSSGSSSSAQSGVFSSAGASSSASSASEASSSPSAAAPSASSPAQEPEQAGGEVSADVKEALDSYEAFMDEYVAFMQKYKESGDVTSMLADYSTYMQKYADLTAKVDAMDTDNMSAADYAYYIEVTTRVSQKLLNAAV